MSAFECTPSTDLAWLATRYALGELPAAEAAAFEARLAIDEAACEAVAHAMQSNLLICAALELSESVPCASRSVMVVPQPTIRSAGSAITAIAVTAIAAASLALTIGRSPMDSEITRKDGADKIVAAWASGEAARNATADDNDLDSHDDADLDPPDWLLAALTAEEVQQKLPSQDEVLDN